MIFLQLRWCSPNTSRKASYAAIGHSFPYLKRLEISGYCGRDSDFQIALYMIGNATSSLKKIVIVPSCHPYDKDVLTTEKSLKREEAGRSHAKSRLSECTPPWVELAVLQSVIQIVKIDNIVLVLLHHILCVLIALISPCHNLFSCFYKLL